MWYLQIYEKYFYFCKIEGKTQVETIGWGNFGEVKWVKYKIVSMKQNVRLNLQKGRMQYKMNIVNYLIRDIKDKYVKVTKYRGMRWKSGIT